MSRDEYYDWEEDEAYARPSYYPPGYREDEELYVYDQCCGNCGRCPCPLEIDDGDSIGQKRHKEKMRREDAAMRDGEPTWCIYWQGRRRGR